MDEFEKALESAKAGSGYDLLTLARKAPPEFHGTVLSAVRDVKDRRSQIRLSLQMARYFMPPLQSDAITQAVDLAKEYALQPDGVDAARCLVDSLRGIKPPHPLQKYIASEALNIASAIMANQPADYKWARAMIDLGRIKDEHLASDIIEMLCSAALHAARNLDDPAIRAGELMNLVQNLSDRETKLRVMGEALESALAIENSARRIDKLNGLQYPLPYDLKQELLRMALKLEDIVVRAETLGNLARFTPNPLRAEALQDSMALTLQIKDRQTRIAVLSRLVAYLPSAQRNDVVNSIRTIKDPEDRAITLSGIARYLPDEIQASLIRESLDLAWGIKEDRRKNNALGVIAANMLMVLKGDVDTLLQGGLGKEKREAIWKSLHWSWRDFLLQEVIIRYLQAVAKHVPHPAGQASAASMVSLRFRGTEKLKILEDAIAAARKADDVWMQVRTLASLAWYFPNYEQKRKTELLEESMALTRQIPIEQLCMDLKRSFLTKNFEFSEYTEVLVGALQLLESDSPDLRGLALVDVATGAVEQSESRKQKQGLNDAVVAVDSIKDHWIRARTFVGLVKHFHGLKIEALKRTRQVKDDVQRVGCLRTLANNLPEKMRKDVLQEALSVVHGISDSFSRLLALSELLEPHPELERLKLAERLLKEISQLAEYERARLLERVYQYLPGQVHPESLRLIESIENDHYRCEVIGEAVRYLSEVHQREVAEWVSRVEDDLLRVRTQCQLANHADDELRGELTRQAYATALDITDEWKQIQALQIMVEKLPKELGAEVTRDVLIAVRRINDSSQRLGVLMSLEKNAPFQFQSEIMLEIEKARKYP